MVAEIHKIEKTSFQINTDFFEVKWQDTVFEKVLAKVRAKKGTRREDFLIETIGNAMKKRKKVQVTGADWDSAIDEMMEEIIKEV